jgi:hypothetical protein
MTHTFNTGFTNNKIADYKTQHAVASSCFDTTLETDRFEKISEVMVYPNQLQISSPFLYKTERNLRSSLIFIRRKIHCKLQYPQISNQFTPISEFSPGFYYLKIETNSGPISKKK